jgi:hypothetical protein
MGVARAARPRRAPDEAARSIAPLAPIDNKVPILMGSDQIGVILVYTDIGNRRDFRPLGGFTCHKPRPETDRPKAASKCVRVIVHDGFEDLRHS